MGVCRNRPTGTEDGRATEVNMKTYVVYFFIKANRTEYLADVAVEAPTAKAACALCKDWYFKTTGKNAFRPTTKLSDEDRRWYEDHNRIKHFDAALINAI